MLLPPNRLVGKTNLIVAETYCQLIGSNNLVGKRTYGDPCGIARALDAVGERWALLVVRELLLGPKRFTDLRTGLPNVGPDVLSQRLRELKDAGVVRRAKLPPPAASRVYELTERGRKLEPVVLALGRWGSQEPFPAEPGELGIDALMLALKTLFDPVRADPLMEMSFGLQLGEQRFEVRVTEEGLAVERGPAQYAFASIATDAATLQQVLWHGRRVRDAPLTIAGDRRAGEQFLTLFPLPE
jgi:DNA-binding HxlR family transcriptional regulator